MNRDEFIEGIYDFADENLKSIYATQKDNEGKILNNISTILLNYTIVDSVLKLTNKEKSDNYFKLSGLILNMFGEETKNTTKATKDTLIDVIEKSFDSYGIKSHKDDVLKIIKEHYKGKHFSERIWDNENAVSKMIHMEIKDFLDGKVNVNQIKSKIESQFNANKYNVKRLVDSEIGNIQSNISEKYFKDYNIKKVKYNATLCSTCEKCRSYHDKVFNTDDNNRPYLPQHPQCHCFYVQVDKLENKDTISEIGSGLLDSMSNRFVPKFGEEKELKLGSISINEKKVSNSKFNMWTDLDSTKKNKAVRLYEKKLESIMSELPEGFELPKFSIVDFDKNKIGSNAIAGYMKEINTIFINSKYDTDKKITKYLKLNKGFFASVSHTSPLLHELGHKYHYDLVESIAKKSNISYNKAKEIFDSGIEKYILSQKLVPEKFISNQLSGYAAASFTGANRINEIIAEYFTVKESKDKSELVKFIENYIIRGD